MTCGATRESILCRNEECDRGKPRVSQLMWPGYTEKRREERQTIPREEVRNETKLRGEKQS